MTTPSFGFTIKYLNHVSETSDLVQVEDILFAFAFICLHF